LGQVHGRLDPAPVATTTRPPALSTYCSFSLATLAESEDSLGPVSRHDALVARKVDGDTNTVVAVTAGVTEHLVLLAQGLEITTDAARGDRGADEEGGG
jgi:hypothetical protein